MLPTPIVITGGSGSIGIPLCRRLALQGVASSAFGRTPALPSALADVGGLVQWHSLDLLQPGALRKTLLAINPKLIVHLAVARAWDGATREDALTVNLQAAADVVSAAHQVGARVVVAGSSFELGRHSEPMSESTWPVPDTWHGTTKLMATVLALGAAREHALDLSILRFFSVYGPWEARHKLVPTAFRAIRSGEPIALTPRGWVRDWVFVEDVVDAIVAAAISFTSEPESKRTTST